VTLIAGPRSNAPDQIQLPEGGVYGITIYQGADFWMKLYVREPDGITPIDLSNYTAQAQVRTKEKIASDLLADFDATIDGLEGSVTIHLAGTVTETFVKLEAFWDLFLVGIDDQRTMLIQGPVLIDPAVTDVFP